MSPPASIRTKALSRCVERYGRTLTVTGSLRGPIPAAFARAHADNIHTRSNRVVCEAGRQVSRVERDERIPGGISRLDDIAPGGSSGGGRCPP